MTIIAAPNKCRTVSCNENLNFILGNNGVTTINFYFSVTGDWSTQGEGLPWFAFWIYSNPWTNTREVDFIESVFGPGTGLNTNFAGQGTQVAIYDLSTLTPWNGTITATFANVPNSDEIAVTVVNSVNSNVGTATLSTANGYFFVLDTAGGATAGTNCQITISNLTMA
jgi:hypothetical protein